MNERINPETGEVTNLPATVDTTMATAIAKAELDTRITTARAYPRSIQTAVESILSLATYNEKAAESMIYALPRGNKPIVGASIRMAEVINQCWGNCVSESRVVAIDRVNKIITAEGSFTDLQTNSTVKATVERRISDKHGRLYSDDMITVTGNAARSIARRNAILAGVPKAIWEQAYEAAEQVVAGDVSTLAVTREKAIKAFAVYGLKPEQVFQLIDVKGEQDIGISQVLSLRAMFSSVKNGEATVEELLREAARGSTNFDRVANPLQDDVANKSQRRKAPASSKTAPEPASAPAAPAEQLAAGQSGGAQRTGPTAMEETRPSVDASSAVAPALSAATVTDDLLTDDQLMIAHKRGADAKIAGHNRRAIPIEYREPNRRAECEAWISGFDWPVVRGGVDARQPTPNTGARPPDSS
jgi:hypothetical protein